MLPFAMCAILLAVFRRARGHEHQRSLIGDGSDH